ncbi:chlorophyll synthesis pathway protein BchC [Kwoniella dejecticola CBS 10117]|uniref:L-arabinitol 4-dehydrogenase n=1 Tax=Kwoniella dejecticola CBS 10117 TaxID=1296121 RepID=A0A1A6A8L0_9TREE|nr:chlorophyll synthesis pathway protein BchC [Kwoniella dejecticola CBS 10117]OBR86390.1 chlorophyll synthesis pathway protein BchC [Kwoniella dejecticola CBS 10117]
MPSTIDNTPEKVNGLVKHPKKTANGHAPLIDVKSRPNLALWVTKDHKIYQKEESYPACGPEECVIHVKATGICGSEIHFWKTGRIGDCCVTHDIILGHESSGQILEVGSSVRDLQVGDRVSIEPGVACWECDMCVRGRYNLCPKVVFSGTPPSDGTMRRFVAHPARFLHKIPDNMSYATGALIEPLSVAYNAIRRASPYLGQPIVICGAGPIGLAAALCARAAGASPIVITDLEQNRLDQAYSMGFRKTLKIELGWDRLTTAAKIREVMGTACLPQLAFEATGAASSINSACYALEDGGTLVQIGCGKPDIEIPLMSMGFREINIITSFRYQQSWPVVIRLAAEGVLGDVDALITHTFPIEETVDAFETCVDRSQLAIKVQIVDE